MTLLVGLKIQNPVKTDYKAMGDSFLMSTIALGRKKNSLFDLIDKI